MSLNTEKSGQNTATYDLHQFRDVSVCELSGPERFVVWAIRWRCSAQDDESFAADCLSESFSRAGLDDARHALERFVCAACPERLHCPTAERLGCWRLNRLEAHSLHAIGALQAGLIGEAWLTLRSVCPDAHLPDALEALEDMAQALARSGGCVKLWRRQPAATESSLRH